jgi:hypothetical protein
MKIPLKPKARPIRKRPYKLNPIEDADRILDRKQILTGCWKLVS